MKKKIVLLMATLLLTLTAHAQFEEEKTYVGGSLTGLNLNYNGMDKLNLGVQAQAGYFIEDNWMVLVQAALQHSGNKTVADNVSIGVGARYYIVQNGLYLGANCKLIHAYHSYNDLMPGVELGYAFFVSRTVTIEPAIYYDQSFKSHKDYSTIGLKIGIGVYI
nr:hypothetical protein [Hoylesella enoeca]